jgi:hypothetical protein
MPIRVIPTGEDFDTGRDLEVEPALRSRSRKLLDRLLPGSRGKRIEPARLDPTLGNQLARTQSFQPQSRNPAGRAQDAQTLGQSVNDLPSPSSPGAPALLPPRRPAAPSQPRPAPTIAKSGAGQSSSPARSAHQTAGIRPAARRGPPQPPAAVPPAPAQVAKPSKPRRPKVRLAPALMPAADLAPPADHHGAWGATGLLSEGQLHRRIGPPMQYGDTS